MFLKDLSGTFLNRVLHDGEHHTVLICGLYPQIFAAFVTLTSTQHRNGKWEMDEGETMRWIWTPLVAPYVPPLLLKFWQDLRNW